MVDFRKKITGKELPKKIDPIEIYDSLDRASDKGPLRPAQHAILENWYKNNYDNRDQIIKLHTGQGKTLIGLLILQSRINADKGPSIFICPNILLVEQTCEQARQFGIKYCKVDENNQLPTDFIEGKTILITHVQKVFTGHSIFGTGKKYENVGAMVLDDSHACIDSIQNAVTIKIPRTEEAYSEILRLFEDDLEAQGSAKLEEIRNEVYDVILPVPYWAWHDKNKELAAILIKHRDKLFIKFAWNLIQDEIQSCSCIVSANQIEIIPHRIPIEQFGSYFNAQNRIFMSATTNNDSFFIKGLGLEQSVVKTPLLYDKEKWSGEKMILIPNLIQDEINRVVIVNSFGKENKGRKFGIVVLVPSFYIASYWEEVGAIVAKNETIGNYIEKLKNGDYSKTIVFANRYDGIDLPDDMCRILIIDRKPFSQSLLDQYQENCRTESDLIAIKIAQKIEQGLGRGVRGEKDYCAIVIASLDLIALLRNKKFRKYFSPQTNKQVEIGLEVARMAAMEATTDDGWKILTELINQALTRDEGWKEYYIENMNSIAFTNHENNVLSILELEKKAEDLYSQHQFEEAASTIQRLIDSFIDSGNQSERGWYLQEWARLLYPLSKVDSNMMQINAHKSNRSLLRPKTGMVFKKLEINRNRLDNIRDYLSKFDDFNELKIEIVKLTSDMTFGVKADTFEFALCEIGKALGFGSERPDHEWKNGPDNLWNIKKGQYILFECKSEVLDTRDEINKNESGQMNNSCAWFNNNYSGENVKNIMIIPTKNISKAGGFNEDVQILRKNGLNKIKKNVVNFFNELRKFDLQNLSDEQLHTNINAHELSEDDLWNKYFDQPYQKK